MERRNKKIKKREVEILNYKKIKIKKKRNAPPSLSFGLQGVGVYTIITSLFVAYKPTEQTHQPTNTGTGTGTKESTPKRERGKKPKETKRKREKETIKGRKRKKEKGRKRKKGRKGL